MQKRGKELKKNAGTASTHHAACSRLYISDHAARRRDRTLLQLNAPESSSPAWRPLLLFVPLHLLDFPSLLYYPYRSLLFVSFHERNPLGPCKIHEYIAIRWVKRKLRDICIEYHAASFLEHLYIHAMFALIHVSYDTYEVSVRE